MIFLISIIEDLKGEKNMVTKKFLNLFDFDAFIFVKNEIPYNF